MDTRTQTTHAAVFASVTELILRGGVPAVTLSAVCKTANISKGGLMHHFPTKEKMVHAFVSQSCDERLEQTRQQLANVKPGEGRRTLAFIDALLRQPAMCDVEESRALSAVMIALTQGSFTDIGLRYYDTLHRELKNDGIPRSIVNLVLTTIDGLWFQSTCVPIETVEKLARQLRGQLRRIVHDVVRDKQQLLGATS
ncbi:MAG: TetR/AcrR family transcriptional regulator [Planctomycetota bacterium]